MLKKYLQDIAFMQVLNLLIKPIWILVIDRSVQEALPLEVYGNYAALFNFSLLFFIVLDLGLNTFNTTQVSRDVNKIVSLTGNILGLKILLAFVYLVIAVSVGLSLGYSSNEFGLLAFLFALQIITSMNQYLRSIVNGLQRFKWDGIFMVLDRVVIVAICAILIWGGINGFELSIQNFIYAQLIGVFFTFFVLLVFLKTYLVKIKITFNLNKIIPLFKKSWPFALMITLMGLFNYVDSVMLKSMIGDAETGIYAMGYRLYYALLMFAQIFSGVLLAFFSKNLKNKEIISTIGSYTIKLLLLVGVTVAFISLSYKQELIDLLYPTKSSEIASEAFSILMFGFLGSALVLVYGTLLTAALELRYLNISASITLIFNLILNYLLIPEMGALGAACATLFSQVVFGGLCYLISYRKFNFKLNFIELTKQVLGVVLLFLAVFFGKQYFVNVTVHFAIIILTILLVGYIFRLYKVNQLKSLMRN